MTLKEIKDKKQKDYNDLFTTCGVFWAFSNEQFEEGKAKNPIAEGEKYLSIGGGGYMPKRNIQALEDVIKAIEATYKAQIAQYKQREANILYELNNHEAYYTGSIEDTLEALGSEYTTEEVQAVYKKYKAEKYRQELSIEDQMQKYA